MADEIYAVQVTHNVMEVYHVKARSTTEASVALGMHMSGVKSDDGNEPVTLVKTTKTVKRINPPRRLVDDETEPEPVESGGTTTDPGT